MQKPTLSHRKCLPWCELINPYNFFSLSMCFTIRHEKRLGETLKLPRLLRVSGTSRSRKLQCLVSSWTKFWTSRSRLGDMGLGSCLGLRSEGLVHILARFATEVFFSTYWRFTSQIIIIIRFLPHQEHRFCSISCYHQVQQFTRA